MRFLRSEILCGQHLLYLPIDVFDISELDADRKPRRQRYGTSTCQESAHGLSLAR
jgi:hypothetical protein